MKPGRRDQRALMALVASCVTSAACDSGIDVLPLPSPRPILHAIDPPELTAGGGAEHVDLIGLGFVETSQARWNGQPRPTTYRSSSSLTMQLLEADLAVPVAAAVSVETPQPGGGASQVVTLYVGRFVPLLHGVSPAGVVALGGEPLEIRLQGSGFADGGSIVLWDEVSLRTTYVTDSELRAEVREPLLRRGRTVNVRVRNSAPGGGLSGPVQFAVSNPEPAVTGITPDSLTLRTAATVIVEGARFVDGAELVWADTRVTPEFITASSLRAQIPAELNVRDLTIRVENPAPGGGLSNELAAPMRELPPYVRWASPAAVLVGSGAFPLTLIGRDFAPDVRVTWEGADRAVTFVSEDTLVVAVEAADIESSGRADVVTVNPRGGGPSSVVSMRILPSSLALPEGRAIASGFGHVLSMGLDGSDPRALPFGGHQPDSDPTGQYVTYVSGGGDPDFLDRLYLADTRTGDARILVPSSPAQDSLWMEWPRFSPDGQWVYFAGRPHTTSSIREVWRVRRDGSSLERLRLPSTDSRSPDPSPGGDRFAYRGDGSLFVHDIAAGATVALGVGGDRPRWSPDGEWIAYRRGLTVRMIRPDGTDDQELLEGPFLQSLDWSPDGQFLLTRVWDRDGDDDQTALIRLSSRQLELLPWVAPGGLHESYVTWQKEP